MTRAGAAGATSARNYTEYITCSTQHNNIGNMRLLQKDAQIAFERNYPNLSFRDIFGINYLTEEDREALKPHKDKDGAGFIPLEEEDL